MSRRWWAAERQERARLHEELAIEAARSGNSGRARIHQELVNELKQALKDEGWIDE